MNKKEFFEIYQKVKNQEVEINTLDKETVSMILLLMAEELEINSKKIDTAINHLEKRLSEKYLNKKHYIAKDNKNNDIIVINLRQCEYI